MFNLTTRGHCNALRKMLLAILSVLVNVNMCLFAIYSGFTIGGTSEQLCLSFGINRISITVTLEPVMTVSELSYVLKISRFSNCLAICLMLFYVRTGF